MKKIIKLEIENTTRIRSTENTYCEIYSHDKNNGYFEFEIMNEYLTVERPMAVFKFMESRKVWKTEGVLDKNKIKVTFDTDLITQEETVVCFLYLDEEQRTSDVHRFKFKVNLSEIDKLHTYEPKERFIKDTIIVDRTDVVTKEDLQEALKNIETGNISTLGLLTEAKAEETYVKKSEAVDNTNFELVKNRVLALELKTDKDIVYDDREVKERLTTLENKAPVDLSNYATKEELRNVSGSQPLADNLVTKEELEAKHYISDISNLATKEELQEVRNSQPTVDTSHLVTRDELTAKNFLIEHQSLDNLVTKQELENVVTKEELESKHYVTEDKLNNKGYLTSHQDLSNYALKSEIPQPYNDSPLNERVTALESKAIEGGAYDDSDLRNRVTTLENRPNVDLSNYVTSEQLENKHYLTQHQPLDNLVTKEELNSKGYLTEHQNISHLVTNDELNSKGYLTEEVLNSKNYLTEDVLNTKNYLTQHQDLSSLVTKQELENKHYLTEHQPLMHLATTSDLEALRNIAVSKSELSKKLDTTEFNSFKDNVVTKTELAEKGYISDLSNYVTKEELHEATEIDYSNIVTTDELEPYVKKSELPAPYNDSALVSRINVLEAKTDKDTVYNDTEVKQRLTALENRPTTGGGLSTEDVATYTNNIIYVPNGNIVYDKNLKKLYIPKCNVHVGKTSYWCEAQEVSINGSAGFIVFNKAQKRIVGGSVNSTNDVLLGYYDNNIGNYYLNTFSKALKKKKIACLGDSITEGVKANGWQWHRYIDKYFKENGIETTIVNLGVGGTSVCTSSYVSSSLQPFVNRLNTIPTDADVIVIFGGTNDWGNNATLGTISDTGSSSFYGAYKYMLEWFANNRPNAKILTITPLKRYYRGYTSTWTNAQTTRNNKGQLLQDYVRAVKEVSEMYAIPCVDLHNESGLNPVLDIVRTKYMEDGLHPTAEGNKKMYPIILDKLKPLVKYD